MDLIKNEYLKQWIAETYPLIATKRLNNVVFDIENINEFAEWIQKKVYDEAIKEAHSQFRDVCQQLGFK